MRSLLVAAVLPLALAAPAFATNTDGTVSNGEYKSVLIGQTRASVQGVFDATGKAVSRVHRNHHTVLVKRYEGHPSSVITVTYRHHDARPGVKYKWRVIDKARDGVSGF
jgi:hypothetical protein